MSQDGGEDYSSMTADILLKKMKEDKTVVGITSATPTVFGFTEDKRKEAAHSLLTLVSPKKQPLHLRLVSQRTAASLFTVFTAHLFNAPTTNFTGFMYQQQSRNNPCIFGVCLRYE